MLKRILLGIMFVHCLVGFAFAQTASISSGVNWILANQNADKSWGNANTSVTPFNATAEVIRTLKLLNSTGSPYNDGLTWLNSQTADSVNFAANRLLANANSGLDLTPDLTKILSYRNDIDSSWGLDNDYANDVYDTALALQALKAANYSDQSIIFGAISYLLSTQNSDGGWGFDKGDDSNVFITAIVSATLQQFPQMTTIANAVNRATSFIIAHQNSDGGFGSSPSTVYETALEYTALIAVSNNTPVLSNAINYLTSVQSEDGSWNDDPYSTALALKALYLSENVPSPPPPPPAGGKITGTVVDATTNQRLNGVAVVLDSNQLINTSTDSSGNFTLSDIQAGSQTVSLSKQGYKPSSATANVVVDATANLGNIPLLSSYSSGTISGTITDSGGKPLAGVALTINGVWNGNTVTGDDGSFSFTYVTPGTVTITAAKSGYQTVTSTGTVYARTTLTFSPRLSATPSQETTGTLVGRVVDSNWGVPIDHLPGEEGVIVRLSGGITALPDPDNGGKFRIEGLTPNTYQVVVGMHGFTSKVFRAVIMPGVTTDLGTIRLDLTISKMTLTGTVTDAISKAPISGAEVTVVGNSSTGYTDFAGTYAIADIEYPSKITLKASASGYKGRSFSIQTSPWLETMHIALTPQLFTGSVAGTVVDASLGQPLAGVTLTLQADQSVTSTTGSDGKFLFNTVPSGLQQIKLSLNGYSPRTLTTAIKPGVVNDLGVISLGVYPLPASIQGTVWDAVNDAPFAGCDIRTTGADNQQALTAADGTYRIDNATPGTVTVAATAVLKPDYHSSMLTGQLEPGGVLVFNPSLSTTPATTVNVTVQTDKETYQKGDSGDISVYLQNREEAERQGSLRVKILDRDGASVFETNLALNIPSEGTTAHVIGFVLPATLTPGYYKVQADIYEVNGTVVGAGSKRIGVDVSQLSVTPSLPPVFIAGPNRVNFKLVNTGTLAVSAGVLEITLKDPDGQVVASVSQPFSLGLGESRTLSPDLTVPELKFGTYILSYTQNDETKEGQATDIAIPNTFSITPRFNSTSLRVRETAELTINLGNTGRFDLNSPTEAAIVVTVAVPDAGYTETKTLSPAPAMGINPGSAVSYSFIIPDSLTAGQHGTSITVTLPSGSTLVENTQFVVPNSILTLSPMDKSTYNAGETIRAEIINNGGADTQAQFQLSLYDVRSNLVAFISDTKAAAVGAPLPITLTIPSGAVDGSYNIVIKYKDTATGQEGILQKPVTINGVKGNLQLQTDKQTYLLTEDITGLSSVENGASPLPDASLHLQVTAAAGNLLQRTWSSQYDFQQGIRSGVDTFETPDAVTLVPLADNFEDGIFNTDRWSAYRTSSLADYPPVEQSGSVQLELPNNPPRNWISNYLSNRATVTGDFDATVDYNVTSPWNSGGNNHAAGLRVVVGTWNARIDVWGSSPTYGIIDSNGSYTNVGGARTNGKLRIRRVGGTYYTYYWNGSSWINPYSFSGRTTAAAVLELTCFGQGGNVKVLYDNFKVTTHTYPASGTLRLKYDSGRVDDWGNINFNADIPIGTSIKFRTRSADIETNLSSAIWSDYVTSSGSPITSPKGRWLEVEATFATADKTITPTLFDLTITQGHKAGDILWQSDHSVSLAQGEHSSLSDIIGVLGTTGKYILQGVLKSGTGQTVASAEYPFYLIQGDFQMLLAQEKKIYRPGETMTISGEVKNLSSIGIAGLNLEIRGTETGTLYTDTFDIAESGTYPFSFTTTAGNEGIHGLSGTVMHNGTTLTTISDQYEVANPVINASLSAPDSTGNSSFQLTLSLNNIGKINATIALRLTDDSGAVINNQSIEIPAGESRILSFSQQIVGTTTYLAQLSGDLNQTITKTINYLSPPAEIRVTAKIVTDKASYNPGEQVTLSSTINTNSVLENLTASISVTNSQGQSLYSASSPIPLLNQDQPTSVKKYWNTGTNPAGTYKAAIQIFNTSGFVFATSSCDLVIASTINPTALLKGQISLGRQSILTGEPVAVSYNVTNIGNMDLANIALSVTTVNTSEQTVYNTVTDQTSLLMGANYTRTGTVDTTSYSAKDYLVVLRASINGIEETLAGTYFRVEGAPSAPALSAPANGSDVGTLTPTLTVSNAADPNDDRLTYLYELYADSGLADLVTSSGAIEETAGYTSWAVPVPLTENKNYYWRARAFDGKLYGPWMAPAFFRVNTVEDPPTAPVISSPAAGVAVDILTPVLTVTNSTDPDSPSLTYNFQIATDSEFNQIVSSVVGVAEGSGTTSWALPVALQENQWYYWRAQADDWLMEGPWSQTGNFQVNKANDAPSAPVINSPINGSTIASLETDAVVANSIDPDSSGLTYSFEADTVSTFDSANVIRSGPVSEGSNTTLYHLSGLSDNTLYYLRAKVNDRIADSLWSQVTEFKVNTVNDQPTVPILNNPSSGAGVNVSNPNLSIHDSSDLDRDSLTYEFEIYADEAMTSLIAHAEGITETGQITTWTVPVALSENQIYYWHARAFDGVLHSGWMPLASFMVNTANDAPGAPVLISPLNGSTIDTLAPTLTLANAVDPDSDTLRYDYEVYQGNTLITTITNVPGNTTGTTSATLSSNLSDNTVYQWRARAFDGERYGPWTDTASFTTHISQTPITVDIDFEPETLNRRDCGKWVMVRIELPHGYRAKDVDISSIRLEGTVHAELWPFDCLHHFWEHGCHCNRHGHNHEVLMVKFRRCEVIAVLPAGCHVPVHVTGKVGSTPFEGVDIIRVIK